MISVPAAGAFPYDTNQASRVAGSDTMFRSVSDIVVDPWKS